MRTLEPSRVELPSKFAFLASRIILLLFTEGDRPKPRISVTRHDRAVNYRVTNCLARGDIFTCGLRGKIITIRPRKICYPNSRVFSLVILKIKIILKIISKLYKNLNYIKIIKIILKIIYRGVFQQF